jgi:hypothetical protein
MDSACHVQWARLLQEKELPNVYDVHVGTNTKEEPVSHVKQDRSHRMEESVASVLQQNFLLKEHVDVLSVLLELPLRIDLCVAIVR